MLEAKCFPVGQGMAVVGTVQDNLLGKTGVPGDRKDFPGGQIPCDDERATRMINRVFAGQDGNRVFCVDEQMGLAEQLFVR